MKTLLEGFAIGTVIAVAALGCIGAWYLLVHAVAILHILAE